MDRPNPPELRQHSGGTTKPVSRCATRVLLVMASGPETKLFAGPLRAAGYHVLTAATAVEGLALSRGPTPPDAVIVDWRLPDLHGLELLYVLRSDALLEAVPIVLLTAGRAHYDVDAFLECFAVRADAQLAKPFDPHQLVRVVLSLLARGEGDERLGSEA